MALETADDRRAYLRLGAILGLLFSLLSGPAFAGSHCNDGLGKYLACNNPRVMAYLNGLNAGDVGKRLKGVALTDGTNPLKGTVYVGEAKQTPAGVHIFLFSFHKHRIAYLWVDKDAKPFPLPDCPRWGLPASAHVLSGDVYTWKAAQPGSWVIEVDCVPSTGR